MNYDEVLWKDDAAALVELLAEEHKIQPPRLPFTGRTRRRGFYDPNRKAIVISKWVETWVVVHEFVHYLDHAQRDFRKRGCDREPHSQGFYYKLRRITQLLGGEYPWHREYKQIARWAESERRKAATRG